MNAEASEAEVVADGIAADDGVTGEAASPGRQLGGQDPLALLAAAIGALAPEDQAKLARMLVGG